MEDRTLFDRFLEKTEKRFNVEPNTSTVYVTDVMQLVLEFNGFLGDS